jgi:hypothetical protein
MVLGAARLQTQNPHTQPNRMKKSPAPRFHAFAIAVLKALRDAYSAFAAAFRIASDRMRSGDRGALFPDGCFPPALPFCAWPALRKFRPDRQAWRACQGGAVSAWPGKGLL